MEYKYRFLNPPVSTASIDFKLSQTHLDTYAFLSPQKPKDSLTYTVSMQTIQDEDPKNPNRFHNLPSVLELEHMECRESMKPEDMECNYVSVVSIGSEKLGEEQNNEDLFEKVSPSILKFVQCKDEGAMKKRAFQENQKLNSKQKFEESEVVIGKGKFYKQKNSKNQKFHENQKQNLAPKTQKGNKQRSTSKHQKQITTKKYENHIGKTKCFSSHCKDSYQNKNEIEKLSSLMKTSSSSFVNSPNFPKRKQNCQAVKCKSLRFSSPQKDYLQKFGFKDCGKRRKEINNPSTARKRIQSGNTADKSTSMETTNSRSRYGSVHECSTKQNNNAPNNKIDYLSIIAVKMNLRERESANGNTKRVKESHNENAHEKEKIDVLDRILKLKREKEGKSVICQNEELNIKRLIKIKFEQKQNKKNVSLHA